METGSSPKKISEQVNDSGHRYSKLNVLRKVTGQELRHRVGVFSFKLYYFHFAVNVYLVRCIDHFVTELVTTPAINVIRYFLLFV